MEDIIFFRSESEFHMLFTQMCHVVDNESVTCGNQHGGGQGSNQGVYYIFIVAFLLIGLGTSGLSTLGMSFIDENTNPADAGIYIGRSA